MQIDMFFIYVLLYASLYFEVFLLLSFFANSHKKSGQKSSLIEDSDILPKVSITVPCFNEEKTLAGTLDSLLQLNYPKHKLEINVVNDGSTDNTSAIAHEYASKHSQIRAFDKENGGKASAMNLAFKYATGELIGCLDADSFVHKDALLHNVQDFINNPETSAVTPAIIVHKPNNVLQYMQRAEYMIGIFMRKAFASIDSIIITPGPFSIFRKSAIEEVGLWKHAHGTEDFEMGLRLQKAGKIISNSPMSTVYTIAPDTLYKLYRQRLRWVYGFLMNAWDYKQMIGNPKYGNVGVLILPMAIFAIFGAVYLFTLSMWKLALHFYEVFQRISAVGFTLSMPNIDFFFIDINILMLLTAVFIVIILLIIKISSKISGLQPSVKEIVFYILLYGLIAPVWLTSALARATIGAESKWKVLR